MLEIAKRRIYSPGRGRPNVFNERCICGAVEIPVQFGSTELPNGELLEENHAICWKCGRVYRLVEKFIWETLTFVHYWALYYERETGSQHPGRPQSAKQRSKIMAKRKEKTIWVCEHNELVKRACLTRPASLDGIWDDNTEWPEEYTFSNRYVCKECGAIIEPTTLRPPT